MKIWVSYYLRAKTIYRIHSPFLYEIYAQILRVDRYFYDFVKLEKLRSQLQSSSQKINFIEFGAGSKKLKDTVRSVNKIAKVGISSIDQCRVLFNLVDHFKPAQILEFGTSLGISTLYMACARKKSKITTVEINQELIALASANAKEMGLKNVDFVYSTFEDYIQSLKASQIFDFIYLDGNHSFEATCNYWEQLQPFVSKSGIIMLDDIHWSEGMFLAWEHLKKHERVQASIETQYFGLLFLDKNVPNIHHVHIEYWKKPWQIGLFS
jgi:predicted O-methyltransferase YrrM